MDLITAFLAIVTMSYTQTDELKLVWSDEFDYTGLPDKSKWDYEEGFIRNREMPGRRKRRYRNGAVSKSPWLSMVRATLLPKHRAKNFTPSAIKPS